MIRRPPRSTLDRSSAASDVYKRQPLVLPQASTAFHVLVIVLTHELPAVTSAPTVFTVAVLQASVAVGAVKVGVAVHSIVFLMLRRPTICTRVRSSATSDVYKRHVLPQASTAFH